MLSETTDKRRDKGEPGEPEEPDCFFLVKVKVWMAANALSVPLDVILISLTFGHLRWSYFILDWVNEQISSSLYSENELWPQRCTHVSCRYFQFDNTCLFSDLYLNRPRTFHFLLFMKSYYDVLTVPDSQGGTISLPPKWTYLLRKRTHYWTGYCFCTLLL